MNLTFLMSLVVIVIVGYSIFNITSEEISKSTTDVTSSTTEVLVSFGNILPIVLLVISVLSIFSAITSRISYDNYEEKYEEETRDIPIEQKPHKQTYLEFVKEQLSIERLLRK